MKPKVAPSQVSRARNRFERIVRLYRVRPSTALFNQVQRAHTALLEAKRDAVVARWRHKYPCPSCGHRLQRTKSSEEVRYQCEPCGFELRL